jgi:peptide deformylase
MRIKIHKDDTPYLRKRSLPVALPLTPKLKQTLVAMRDHLIHSQDHEYAEKHHLREGVGLAAPQIGLNLRMFVIHLPREDRLVEHALVNPIVISSSVKMTYLPQGEGCLSVDQEYKGYVYRHHKIVLKAYDAFKDENVELTFRGYEAVVVQHEIDHLDGILFYDRIDKNNPFKTLENAEIAQ